MEGFERRESWAGWKEEISSAHCGYREGTVSGLSAGSLGFM